MLYKVNFCHPRHSKFFPAVRVNDELLDRVNSKNAYILWFSYACMQCINKIRFVFFFHDKIWVSSDQINFQILDHVQFVGSENLVKSIIKFGSDDLVSSRSDMNRLSDWWLYYHFHIEHKRLGWAIICASKPLQFYVSSQFITLNFSNKSSSISHSTVHFWNSVLLL